MKPYLLTILVAASVLFAGTRLHSQAPAAAAKTPLELLQTMKAQNQTLLEKQTATMFDPNHNAVSGPYYLVNGDLRGSWEGLPKEVIVLPWYFSKRSESLAFFAGRGHHQVIAGYYDEQPERVKDWLDAAGKFPDSVLGVMYTTWQNRYGDLEKFATVIDANSPPK